MATGECHGARRGSALVELVIVLPTLLMLVAYAVETGRAMNLSQTALALSKEAANAALRECWDIRSDQTQIQECLGDSIDSFGTDLNASIPGAVVVLSVWQCPGMGDPASIATELASFASAVTATSRIDLAHFIASGGLLEVCRYHQRLVFGEAFIPFRSVFPSFISPIQFSNDSLYAVTVY